MKDDYETTIENGVKARMQIPISRPYLTSEEAMSAYETIMSGWVAQGPKVEEFERKFCEYTGAKYSVAVSNCTTALHLAMIAAGIKEGDEVICPSMSFIASANCIKFTGANPVFAEVESGTYNIDIRHSEKLINEKTKAILIVHQIGMPADIVAFKDLCFKYNLKLIEDAACAVGSGYRGKKIGAESELACFSFHPRKVITTGEGGMVVTSDKKYYDRIKSLRQHGAIGNAGEDYSELGYNYRMTDIQASIGIKQLEKLDSIIYERRKIASKYIEELSSIDCLALPVEKENYFSNYQSFCIYLKPDCPVERNTLMKSLYEKGISTRSGILNSHRTNVYCGNKLNLPVSENLSDRSLLIPLYVPMTENEIAYVISSIKKILA